MADHFYDIAVQAANGETKHLGDYKGHALLIVNLASECGLTPQYAGLEALNRKYAEQGLRVLGFPCNDFGGQEPGTIEQVQAFCTKNYGVTFDLFDKVQILGEGKHPLYQYLTTHSEPTGDVSWNFEKFLISKDGELLARFNPRVTPDDAELVAAIEKAL